VRDNRKAFDEYGFVPRVLKDVSGRDQTTMLFGRTYASPFGIPPMGSSALIAYRGDIVLTRAARAANVPMILSASSLITLEDIRRENNAAWFQAYLAGLPERIEPLVDRVAAADSGIDAVDTGMTKTERFLKSLGSDKYGGELLPTIVSLRELIQSFDKKSGALIAETRKMLGEVSQSVNDAERKFGGTGGRHPAP